MGPDNFKVLQLRLSTPLRAILIFVFLILNLSITGSVPAAAANVFGNDTNTWSNNTNDTDTEPTAMNATSTSTPVPGTVKYMVTASITLELSSTGTEAIQTLYQSPEFKKVIQSAIASALNAFNLFSIAKVASDITILSIGQGTISPVTTTTSEDSDANSTNSTNSSNSTVLRRLQLIDETRSNDPQTYGFSDKLVNSDNSLSVRINRVTVDSKGPEGHAINVGLVVSDSAALTQGRPETTESIDNYKANVDSDVSLDSDENLIVNNLNQKQHSTNEVNQLKFIDPLSMSISNRDSNQDSDFESQFPRVQHDQYYDGRRLSQSVDAIRVIYKVDAESNSIAASLQTKLGGTSGSDVGNDFITFATAFATQFNAEISLIPSLGVYTLVKLTNNGASVSTEPIITYVCNVQYEILYEHATCNTSQIGFLSQDAMQEVTQCGVLASANQYYCPQFELNSSLGCSCSDCGDCNPTAYDTNDTSGYDPSENCIVYTTTSTTSTSTTTTCFTYQVFVNESMYLNDSYITVQSDANCTNPSEVNVSDIDSQSQSDESIVYPYPHFSYDNYVYRRTYKERELGTSLAPWGDTFQNTEYTDSYYSDTGIAAGTTTKLENLVGSDWILVRWVEPGTTWHPASDFLQGDSQESIYGDSCSKLSTTIAGGGSGSTYSIKWSTLNFTEFLFSNGDGSKWMIVEREQVLNPTISSNGVSMVAENGNTTLINSNNSSSDNTTIITSTTSTTTTTTTTNVYGGVPVGDLVETAIANVIVTNSSRYTGGPHYVSWRVLGKVNDTRRDYPLVSLRNFDSGRNLCGLEYLYMGQSNPITSRSGCPTEHMGYGVFIRASEVKKFTLVAVLSDITDQVISYVDPNNIIPTISGTSGPGNTVYVTQDSDSDSSDTVLILFLVLGPFFLICIGVAIYHRKTGYLSEVIAWHKLWWYRNDENSNFTSVRVSPTEKEGNEDDVDKYEKISIKSDEFDVGEFFFK